MPKPEGSKQRYMPGLDGLRAIAVLAVIAYHLGIGWAPGGLLGVGIFFTLSGYLITDLLLHQWDLTGGLKLSNFWIRRARRLLPALYVMLAVVLIWAAVLHPGGLSTLRGYVVAALLYVGNWWSIARNASYFARFGPPPPLDHLWSLAVEEQFYLIWPFLLLGGLKFVRDRRAMAAITLVLAAISSILMALNYHPGYDPTRAYEGTDTRAAGLLIGAALAMLWPSYKLPKLTRGRVAILDIAGLTGLIVIAYMIAETNQYSGWLYQGGVVVLSLATAAVVATLAHPSTLLGRLMGAGPLRWLGVRSYGIYLWHYPIIVFTTSQAARPSFALQCLQVAATIVVAALSWRFIEEPVRSGAIARLWTSARQRKWTIVPRSTWTAAAAVLTLFVLAGCAFGDQPSAAKAIPTATPVPKPAILPNLLPWNGQGRGAASRHHHPSGLLAHLRTSCQSVAYIGDSTSEGMILVDYLPNAAQRLPARLRSIGVKWMKIRISGARSIVEVLPGQANGQTVAQHLVAHGFHGCWIIALGTNDTANVAVGSPVSRAQRIDLMMSVIKKQRVMWVSVKTLLSGTAYSESNMRLWNQALIAACPAHPNMRIFNWASEVKPNWYISDLTHYTSNGYEHRAVLTAKALADAWPAKGKPKNHGCWVT